LSTFSFISKSPKKLSKPFYVGYFRLHTTIKVIFFCVRFNIFLYCDSGEPANLLYEKIIEYCREARCLFVPSMYVIYSVMRRHKSVAKRNNDISWFFGLLFCTVCHVRTVYNVVIPFCHRNIHR
jgi:hypothetical protein